MSDPVDRLLAESEIRNLLGRLAHLADDGDLAEYITLFTSDASWKARGVTVTGREALLAAARQRRADGGQGPGSGTRHLVTTTWVRIDSPDEAYAESYWLFVDSRAETGAQVLATGRYHDTFRRTEQGWKLHHRHINTEVN